MSLRLITDASTEPLTLAQARRHLRIDDDYTAEDADISDMIVAARRQAEHETGRTLTAQTWERVLDAFPAAEIELGMPSVIAITHIKYVDPASVEQTLDSAQYVLDRDTDPGYVMPAAGTTWPDTYADTTNAVRVRFTTGYLADEDKDRALLRQWMRVQIKFFFDGTEPSPHNARLLDGYRVHLL